jgi:hypothetical protein
MASSIPFPPTPIVRRLDFDAGAMSLITSVEGTTTVNWSAAVTVDKFLEVVERTIDVGHDPEVTIQRSGVHLMEQQYPSATLVPSAWLSGPDPAVEFYRIDVSDTRSVAWQRLDASSVFVGLGDADSFIIVDTTLTQLMADTARSEIDVDLTISTVREVARGQTRDEDAGYEVEYEVEDEDEE